MCFVIYCNQLRHRKLINSGLFKYSPAEDTYIIYRTTTKKTVRKRINQISEIMQTPTYILNALSCYISLSQAKHYFVAEPKEIEDLTRVLMFY